MLLDRTRLWSVFPLASTLHLLSQFERRGSACNLIYSLGLVLERGGAPFEVDYVAILHDGPEPTLIVGECKARDSVDLKDVENLEAVRDAIRLAGANCLIAVSSSKDALSADEIQLLRDSAERSYDKADGRAHSSGLPLVPTRTSLTVPELDSSHPLVEARTGSLDRLRHLARGPVRRRLGSPRTIGQVRCDGRHEVGTAAVLPGSSVG